MNENLEEKKNFKKEVEKVVKDAFDTYKNENKERIKK